jgi:CCR4-NOT transcription complex subunit 6
MIQQELEETQGDIVCLQEVQADHYEQHLNPFMQALGYDSMYKQKSRESMGGYGKVDGCATFWRRTKFIMVENYAVEFNDCAREAAAVLGLDDSECRKYMNRLSRDNVAQLFIFEVVTRGANATGVRRQMSHLCVVNTHIYSNHTRPDVKLWQSIALMREVENVAVARDVAVLVCGDFNSEPDSAVHEFMAGGALQQPHPELEQSDNLGDGNVHLWTCTCEKTFIYI